MQEMRKFLLGILFILLTPIWFPLVILCWAFIVTVDLGNELEKSIFSK